MMLGGGAHVFSETGYEFETGVHYLGHDREMEDLMQVLAYQQMHKTNCHTICC
jgi:hypothetical protein